MLVFCGRPRYSTYILVVVFLLILWQIYRYHNENSKWRSIKKSVLCIAIMQYVKHIVFAMKYLGHASDIGANRCVMYDSKTCFIELIEDYDLETSNQSRVVISVFYEALCPDSKGFILRHLIPSVEKVPYKLNVNLVPYGKAETIPVGNDRYEFRCQHRNVECDANKIHSCAVKYIRNKLLLLKYIGCMIADNSEPDFIAKKCADEWKIVNWPMIWKCARSSEAEHLLKAHGESTRFLTPPLTFVPTVLLNDKQYNQAHILKNLWKQLCTLFRDHFEDKC